MASCVLTSANILMGGNSGFRSRWVSGRCVCRDRQNFSGSSGAAASIGGIDVVVHSLPGDGSHGFAAAAAHFIQCTDFCGFQRVAWFVVARPASHSMGQATDFCGFQAACRLTVSYPPSHRAQIGMGAMAGRAQLGGEGGRPPFHRALVLHLRRGCGGTRFQKKAETGPSSLPSQNDGSEAREIQVGRMGSGVRASSARQKLAEKRGFRGARVGFAKGVGGKVAGHVPSDVAVAAMLCGAVNRVN